MKRLAVCFSGQGSQYINMGLDFINDQDRFKEMAIKASEILGFNVIDALSDIDKINQTRYTQPLILLKTLFGYEMIKRLNIEINSFLGFSLGEYSAYYAAEIFGFREILTLVSKRAEFMEQDTKKVEGKMAAVIGLDKETIKSVCKTLQSKGTIDIANDNAPSQVVISGESELINEAIGLLKTKGARRVIEVKTSGAFHTGLMKDASQKLIKEIKSNETLKPKVSKNKIYMNFNAKPLEDHEIYLHIEKQIISEVKFRDSILNMKQNGITHILEIGPGKVLTNLIKKIDLEIDIMNFDQLESYETVKGWLETYEFTK